VRTRPEIGNGALRPGLPFISAAALAALMAVLGEAGAPAAQPHASGSASAGRSIALDICSPCHVVAPDQADEPVLNQKTPTFQEIADDPKTSAASLRRFTTTTHWDGKSVPVSMPSPMLMGRQADDVAAYILSLRRAR
jgi:mono/diheme cytochrome c family protein